MSGIFPLDTAILLSMLGVTALALFSFKKAAPRWSVFISLPIAVLDFALGCPAYLSNVEQQRSDV